MSRISGAVPDPRPVRVRVPRTQGPPPRLGPATARVVIDRAIVTTLFLVAAIVSAYPLGAMYLNDRNAFAAAQEATVSQRSAATTDPVATQQVLEAAYAYNEALPEIMLLDPIYGQEAPESVEYQEYLSTMGGPALPVGTLVIPDIDSSMPIFHGTDDEVLNKGVGHMFGTHLPVGGEGTHAVLSAHRGLPNLTAFDNLPDLAVGDMFFVESLGQTLAYEVRDINTVLPNDLDLVKAQDGRDLITLVTCTPYAINTHRLLVTGERVPWEQVPEPVKATATPAFAWSPPPGSWPRIAVAATALLVLLAMALTWARDDIIRPLTRRRLHARLAALLEKNMTASHTVPATGATR